MNGFTHSVVRVALGVVLVVGSAHPGGAAGFNIFEQGSRAMGMAGAFTAQADDSSTLFHNVGGLGFLKDEQLSAGFTYITGSEHEFRGGEPFPGTDVREELETLQETPPHIYWIKPLNEQFSFGLAVNSPFGLTTEWPADFSGRFVTTRASLVAVDLAPSIGLRLTDRLSVGASAVMRVSKVELDRSQAAINPFTLAAAEIAKVRLESDFENGFGWQFGLLHKPTERWSWGFTYRSRLETHYKGTASFDQLLTGFGPFDAVVADSLPFGTGSAISTDIKFPDTASLGVACELSNSVLVEVDANWAGWNSFDEIVVGFADERLDDLTLSQRWEEVNNYRLGVRWTTGSEREWRFGYVFDENPIPDETVGPLLPDSDRNGITVGWGHAPGVGGFDLALMYLPFDERTTTINENTFNGTYNTTVWLLGVTWTR